MKQFFSLGILCLLLALAIPAYADLGEARAGSVPPSYPGSCCIRA